MNRENIYKASELNHTIACLRSLKRMVKDRFFKLKTKKKFTDYYDDLNFSELNNKTRTKLETVLIDFCDSRIAEIEEEFKEL